jgi:hypothetical protein
MGKFFLHRYMLGLLALFLTAAPALGQTPAPPSSPAPQAEAPAKPRCGPDHAIIYKRAVKLLDDAEKKLNARYVAEAKSLAKEANSLFTILHKECGQEQKDRPLSEAELQQESMNQKLHADEFAQAERLEKSAQEKLKKSDQVEAAQPELAVKLAREAKAELELAHRRYIKAEIYVLRNQQMNFRWIAR